MEMSIGYGPSYDSLSEGTCRFLYSKFLLARVPVRGNPEVQTDLNIAKVTLIVYYFIKITARRNRIRQFQSKCVKSFRSTNQIIEESIFHALFEFIPPWIIIFQILELVSAGRRSFMVDGWLTTSKNSLNTKISLQTFDLFSVTKKLFWNRLTLLSIWPQNL